MSDPLKLTAFQRLSRAKGLIVWMTPIALVSAAIFYFKSQVNQIDPEHDVATVMPFGTYSDYDGNHPTMIIRTGQGTIREILADPEILRSCRRGDKVLLLRRGLNLRVAPEACALPENQT